MWSDAIILFLKQPDFFLRILKREGPIDVQALIAKATLNDSINGLSVGFPGREKSSVT